MATSLTGQTLLIPDQANAEVTANELFLAVEQLGALKILSDALLDPPGSPSDFDAYLIPPTGTAINDWDGYANDDVAFYYQGWIRIQKKEGMTAYYALTDPTPEKRGMIAYSADRATWYNLSSPIWNTAKHFTGRYTAEAFNFSGTANYAIYGKAFQGTLAGPVTTVPHGESLVFPANYAWVSSAFLRRIAVLGTAIASNSDVDFYTIPDDNHQLLVDGTNLILATSLTTPADWDYAFYLEFAQV